MLLANRADGSARGPAVPLWGGLTLMGVLVVSAFLAACGDDRARPGLVVSVSGAQPGVNCSGVGCPCASEGAKAACGETQSVSGDNIVCVEGTRSCRGGAWGVCEPERRVTKYAPRRGSGSHLLDLAASPVSCADPCDPACKVFNDTPPGLTPGPDFTVDGNGLTLPARQGGGSCSNVVIEPTSATITVTSLRPVETQPEALKFTATCGVGGPVIEPAWVLRASDSDAARIDEYGIFRAVSGIAKTVQVTGATAFGFATATVDVLVDINEIDPECEATSDSFLAAPSGTEPGKTLYPYAVPSRPVVFPLGLGGPLVQWSTGGVNAECVKISLAYPPAPANASFRWSRVFAPSLGGDAKLGSVDASQPAAPIDDDVWGGFARAAAGKTGEIVVQRHVAGQSTALPPMAAIPVQFASDVLRGTAYFTQYLRRFRDDANLASVDICAGEQNADQPDLDIGDARYQTSARNGCVNADCSANAGPMCPVGNCTQAKTFATPVVTLQALDLANPAQGLSLPFRDAPTGSRCVACHSISADGSTLVASDYSLSGVQTIAKLETDTGRPNALSVAQAPTYSWTSNGGDPVDPEHEQSKGLSYAALSPDGRYVLQGPNYWGNTDYDVPLGAGNVQDAAYAAGGKRYFLLDLNRYRRAVQVATTAPLPTHSALTDTLIGASPGVLQIDGVEVSNGDSVLVKDELNPVENGVYEVDDSSWSRPFRLIRRTDNGGSGELAFGDKFLVQGGSTNGGKYLHIAEPSGAPVNPGVTPLTFALYTTVTAATSVSLPAHSVIVDADGVAALAGVSGVFQSSWVDDVPLDSSLSILVKDETGANAAHNGIYSLVDPGQEPWRLVRRAEADADPEVSSGLRVRVNQGTNFGGKTFVVGNVGAITLGVTPLTIVVDPLLDEGTKYDRGGVASTLPTMMYPTFSPDGSALVYVNGDADTLGTGSAAAGWRRGLSLLSFSRANPERPFSNKRRLLNTFSADTAGAVIKWPFFEPDSRSVVFVRSSPDEFCPIEAYRGHCTGPDCEGSTEGVSIDSDVERACFKWNDPNEYGHGNGAPVARGYWPGRLQSVNTQSQATAELGFLNDGLASQDALAFAADGGKAYQPSVLPFTAGGYRWVVFTSTRAYGNQLNALGTHFTCAAPLLWMAALDDTAAGGSDRSHPAFLMPGQNLRSILSNNTRAPFGRHYLNERGYVVPSVCKTEHDRCTADSECCGAGTANPPLQCRLREPPIAVPTHHRHGPADTRLRGDQLVRDHG
jgi:hypothetical protein